MSQENGISSKKNLKVVIISDGTGETATSMVRAAMTQFHEREIFFTRYKNVRTIDHLEAIYQEAAIHHDLVAYTLVTPELRNHIVHLSRNEKVRCVDLLGGLLTHLSNIFEAEPDYQPGLLHAVNDKYFDRVAAVEFTLNHDDGRNLKTLEEADVILLGISRTSKTPLSIYLSLEGLKVVNIPIVLGQPLPEKLLQVDQRKIFALTIDPQELYKIRLNRLTRLGVNDNEYADLKTVTEEIQWAMNLFNSNKRWPVFDVTAKALEETAAEIIKLLQMRKNNRFKQDKRFNS
jgi:regulator of PEP synthase PpsR (kinase-PPPase family)